VAVDRLQTGDPGQVGVFRLLGRLGEGGMGRVFLGESRGGRKVAIKVVHPHYANDPEFRRRFAREVAAARQVGGFHTAAVVGADPEADPPWMATAYIPGPSLTDAVAQRGPLDTAGVGRLGAALAEGLAAIHECGLIHRDLKPGNVILAEDGPRIIDFGIAKGADATALTGSSAVIGTLRYMSPEQLNGQELTPQSDVFALGTVLAYAATGHDPFQAPTIPGVINRILSGPPDLDPLSGELRGIIADCLAKDPSSRPSPGDLLARFSRPAPHDPAATAAPAPAPAPGSAPAAVPPPELRLAGAGGPARAAQGPSPASAAGPGRLEFATTTSALRPSPVSARGPWRRQDGGAESPEASPGQISGPDDAARRAEATAKAKERTQAGDSLYGQHRYADAEAAYREAVRLDSGYLMAHYGLGCVFRNTGRLPDAETAYREAIRLNSGNFYGYNGLGVVLRDTKRYLAAEAAFREAIRLNPGNFHGHNGLGTVLYEMKRYPEAEAAYREAIRALPDNAYAYNGLGNVLRATKRYREAATAYRYAIRIDPNEPFARSNLEEVLPKAKRRSAKLALVGTDLCTRRDGMGRDAACRAVPSGS
jgi:Flp pilus assembly protein TadD/predicted Ser/Thr protein kinase